MSVINQIPGCYSFGPNLGFSACQYVPGIVKGLLFVPKGATITAANAANLQSYINSKLNDTNPALRWHLAMGFQGVESQNEDAVVFTYPSRKKQTIATEVRGARFQLDNSFCQYRNLYEWNAGAWKGYDVFEVTDTVLEGATGKTGNNLVVIGRAISHFWVEMRTYATYSDPEQFFVQIQYADASQSVTSVGQLPLSDPNGPFTLATTNGVQDVLLANPVNGAAGVYTVTLLTGCGGINFANIYGTTLVTAGFTAANGTTGAAITITSAAASGLNAVTGVYSTYTVTLNLADPDYPTVGLPITLGLSQSGLLGLNIGSATTGEGSFVGKPLTVSATV